MLFTPPRLVEIAAVAVMVSGPLRAAARRGETEASVVTLISASLLLSTITFATQFLHPLIDPWAWSHYDFLGQEPLGWVGKNEGVAAILAQALILAGTALLLNSGFRLRTGSLTFVFTLNGLLVTITKLHFEFVPVAIATSKALHRAFPDVTLEPKMVNLTEGTNGERLVSTNPFFENCIFTPRLSSVVSSAARRMAERKSAVAAVIFLSVSFGMTSS